jgi:hypothetical protein
MDTKQNAPQERGAKVIRASGNREKHYTPEELKCMCPARCAALAELEYDKRQFAHLAYGVVPGSHEALKALAEVHRQIVALREQLL